MSSAFLDYRAGTKMPRPLYLVCGRRIDQEGATDRLRPWSTKIEKTAKKSKQRSSCPPFFERREPEQLPGPLRRERRREPLSARTGQQEEQEEAFGSHNTSENLRGGGDVSKDQLDVYVVRHPGEAGTNRSGATTFAVPHSDAGIDALVSRLAEVRPVLVI